MPLNGMPIWRTNGDNN